MADMTDREFVEWCRNQIGFRSDQWERLKNLSGYKRGFNGADIDTLCDLAHARAQIAALTADRDAEDQDRLPRLFDQYGVECQNCGVKIIARGGPDLHEEKRSLTECAGEEEAICGHCAGEEISRLESELRVANGALDGLVGALAATEKRYLEAAEELAVAKQDTARLTRTCEVINQITGDDFCEVLDMAAADGSLADTDLSMAHSKLGSVYRAAHSATNRSCFSVHEDWRNEVDNTPPCSPEIGSSYFRVSKVAS